ncbi:MAG: hypothetical protein L6420_11790 [Elusimicrobia bacterium]|nr:hypothetical protein [Elusimicrobiota bacterium]
MIFLLYVRCFLDDYGMFVFLAGINGFLWKILVEEEIRRKEKDENTD